MIEFSLLPFSLPFEGTVYERMEREEIIIRKLRIGTQA
jgi:hypothetical protein